jgi:hypothetical protein
MMPLRVCAQIFQPLQQQQRQGEQQKENKVAASCKKNKVTKPIT